MKKLFIIRHAKSSWKDNRLKDFDRPLNKRGEKNLEYMSKFFSRKYDKPDYVLSSPAKRAKITAEGFCLKLDYPLDKIYFLDELYMASSSDLIKIISNINPLVNSIIIFGHNPGLTDLVNLIGDKYIENIPTCGIVELETENNWNVLPVNSFRIINFFYPKMLDV